MANRVLQLLSVRRDSVQVEALEAVLDDMMLGPQGASETSPAEAE